MKKKDTDKFLSEIISGIPYCIYVLMIIPILGVVSYNAFMNYVNTTSSVNNTVILLIIIFSNLILLLGILYGFNVLTKFKVKKFLLIGGTVFVVTLFIALKMYFASKGSDLHGATALVAQKNYGQAKGMCLIYSVYFILTFFVNKIAQISIKNKNLKSSR